MAACHFVLGGLGSQTGSNSEVPVFYIYRFAPMLRLTYFSRRFFIFFLFSTGLNASESHPVPTEWSGDHNLLWMQPLPGTGSADPVVRGDRIYLVGYQGYGEELVRDMNQSFEDGRPRNHREVEIDAGDMEELEYWIQVRSVRTGELIWEATVPASEERHPFRIFLPWHGYASAHAAVDEHGAVAFFGPEGLFAFDHEGRQQWRASVGEGVHRWGTGSSPVIVDDVVVVNAYPESGALYGLDRHTGERLWKTPDIALSWATPVVMEGPGGKEIIISMKNRIVSYSVADGSELWSGKGIPDYIAPTPVVDGDIVYVIGGRADFAIALKRGGEVLWEARKGSNVSSPVLSGGHLFFADDQTTQFCVLDAQTGEVVVEKQLAEVIDPDGKHAYPMFYASPVVSDGNIFLVSRQSGTFVLQAESPYAFLAQNVFSSDDSIWNASPVVDGGRLFLRSGSALYCVGVADD